MYSLYAGVPMWMLLCKHRGLPLPVFVIMAMRVWWICYQRAYVVSMVLTKNHGMECLVNNGIESWNCRTRQVGRYDCRCTSFLVQRSAILLAVKRKMKAKGYCFLPLMNCCQNEVICCCLNRNTVLLHAPQFEKLGNRRYCSTPDCRRHGMRSLLEWLNGDNLCFAIP